MSCSCQGNRNPTLRLLHRRDANHAGRDREPRRVAGHSIPRRHLPHFLANHAGRALLVERPRAGRPAHALDRRLFDRPIDAWSEVLDILTFYTERLANEAYLGTAIEGRSVFELARLVGYKPSPGVSASTVLAFTLASAPGSPAIVPIPAGTRVQSVPGPGQRRRSSRPRRHHGHHRSQCDPGGHLAALAAFR